MIRKKGNILREFCEETTFHGFRYLIDYKLPIVGRLFFAVSIIASILGSASFLNEMFNEWKNSPILIGYDSIPSEVIMEPFPSVTICNLNQADKKKVQGFAINSKEYAMLQMLCKREFNLTIAQGITDWNGITKFLMNISQDCSELLLTCKFGSVEYNCSELFTTIINDEGVCCNFNRLHGKYYTKLNTQEVIGSVGYEQVNWSPQDGYPEELPEYFSPFQTAGTGQSLGLSITLNVDAENYYCSSMNSIGFKIGLHNPIDSTIMAEMGTLLRPGREIILPVYARKIKSSPNIRNVKPKFRNCYFQDEYDLAIYRYYTTNNCNNECITQAYTDYCGCVPHYKITSNTNTSICNIYDLSCVKNISKNVKFCNAKCLSSCNAIFYTYDVWNTPLAHDGFKISNKVVANISSAYVKRNIAIVHIYFPDLKYRAQVYNKVVEITDLLSTVGGLLELFYGCSFISLVEVIYVIFLRSFKKIKFQRNSKKIQPQQIQIRPARKLLKGKHPVFQGFKKPRGFPTSNNEYSYLP